MKPGAEAPATIASPSPPPADVPISRHSAGVVPPAITATASTGIQPWMIPLIVVAGFAMLLAFVPQRFEFRGAVGWYLVRGRIAFAAVGIGLLCGLMIPMLGNVMP